jgi:hypothetical protein
MRHFLRLTMLLTLLAASCRAMAGGVTPFGDVLVWRASEEASSVWSDTIVQSGSTQSLSASNVGFDWNAGFRVGLAHQADEQSWDAKLYWTYFRTSDNTAVEPADQAFVPEFFSGFIAGDAGFFNAAAMNWALTYNTIDFELGRTVPLGNNFSLRPSLGVKAALIDQRVTMNMSSELGLTATERVDNDFRGFGPAFGIGGRWNTPWWKNLSVVGSFSGALLWGNWNVEDAYERTDSAVPILTYGAMTTSMNDSSLGTLELNYFLGLEWVRPGNVTITGRLGYELQWWANQQRISAFQQLPMHGDLTLQGLTCGISVGF